MAVEFPTTSDALKRTTNVILGNADYTCSMYFRITSAPSNYISLFSTFNGIGVYDKWAGLFGVVGGGTLDGIIGLNFENGSGPDDSLTGEWALNTWYHIAYVRSGNTQKLYYQGAFSSQITYDLTATGFSEVWIGNDTFSDGVCEIAYFREWDRALTDDQITYEYRSSFAITQTDLWTDTPLSNDLLDDSGNNHNWTEVGDTDFVTQPQPDRYTAICFGTNIRTSSIYLAGVPSGTLGFGGPIFYLNLGTEAFQLFFKHINSTGNANPDGTITTTSVNWALVVRYFNDTDFVEIVLSNPWVDSMVGHVSTPRTAYPRINWDWHKLEVVLRSSTYRTSSSTYLQDGMLRVRIDEVDVVNLTNIWLKRNASLTGARLTYWPAGDGDGFFVLNKNVLPSSYTGVQQVPVSSYLVDYLNFNDGTAGDWNLTRISPFYFNGPNFNLISGLDDTGSASPGPTDPNVYSSWDSVAGGGSNAYGAIYKILSLLPPDDAPAQIIVTKNVINSVEDETEFDINAGGGLDPATFSLANEEAQTFENLAPGTYSIEEDAVAGYITTYEVSNGDEPDAITIGAGETVYVTITNTKVGSITVIKAASPNEGLEFEFTATNLSPGTFSLQHLEQEVFSNLEPADNYGIEETVPEGWEVQYVVSNGSPIDAISVAAGEDVVVQVFNTIGGGGIWKVPRIPTGPPNTPPNPWVPTDDFPDPDTGEITPVKIPTPFFTSALIQDK